MYNIDEVKSYLTEVYSCVTFEYNGRCCGIDPFPGSFVMWYGANDITVDSIEKVFDTILFDGKSLKEIWKNITDLDY